MHIFVKEEQLKSVKGKQFKISSKTHYDHFSLKTFIGTKPDFLRRFIMAKSDISKHLEVTQNHRGSFYF